MRILLKKVTFVLILICSFSALAQKSDSFNIDVSDFQIKSEYYRGNIMYKNSIYKYLMEKKSEELGVENLLIGECIVLDSENSNNKSEVNEIESQLNSLGQPCLLVTSINRNGDLFYTITRSGNLNIEISKGALFRI